MNKVTNNHREIPNHKYPLPHAEHLRNQPSIQAAPENTVKKNQDTRKVSSLGEKVDMKY
jgi:hypothetical protein